MRLGGDAALGFEFCQRDAGLAKPRGGVHFCFAQRRKTLRNALQQLGGSDRIVAAGIDPGARAEDVDVAGFLALADAFAGPR